ncbi:MAG: D-alanine--D-alanine ligase [Candidatus Promineifilaceae bacterium]|nr:D-alanine--D-alanine ligase [Candidatus Promineifilaceae bacterium]
MNSQHKVKVGVLCGGRSGEHEVSLMSAKSVIAALDTDKYDVVTIGITKTGRWIVGDVAAALESGREVDVQRATLLPSPETSALMRFDETAEQANLADVVELDVVFPVLHGPYGEDGTVQGLLELADLPYVGAGVVGSAVGMDKAIFKAVMQAHELPVLPWRLIIASQWRQHRTEMLDQMEQVLTYPMFVKPANLGSSVGISKVNNREELADGLDQAAQHDRRLVVEQGVVARELEVAVMGNDEPIASVVGEIRPRRDFYDYVAKYVSDDSELIIPADLSAEQRNAVRSMALQVFKAIDCAGLGRVDFLLDKTNEQIYVNELNTIPGFTRISMYPKLWQASGLDYPELLDRLIALARERHAIKRKLKTSYEVERA